MKIKIENIEKKFKNNFLFSNVNLEFTSGNIYGFAGGNGSGKSVLFKIISGFMKPTNGKVYYNDMEVGKDIELLPDLGYCDAHCKFIPYLTGFDNLQLLAKIKNRISDTVIKDQMLRLELNTENKDNVKKYSLGMYQKLAIIQAYMEDQEIIIFDEPFNSLDKKSVKIVKEIILELKKAGKLIFVTSHIHNDLEEISDHMYQIEYQEINQIK